MKKRTKEILAYSVLFLWALITDRLTKYWVLQYLHTKKMITGFLSFEFLMNRGIAWGMFHSEGSGVFLLLSLMIFGLIMTLLSFTYRRYHEEGLIIGEMLVLAGAISNALDRILYRGVIDFIVFSWRGYTFPAFNIADACIVIGVGIMMITVYKKNHVSL